MPKSLILIKINLETLPTDRDELKKVLSPMFNLTFKDLQDGKISDFGMYAGNSGGYVISNQTPEDISRVAMQMQPYVTFEVHPVVGINEFMKLTGTQG